MPTLRPLVLFTVLFGLAAPAFAAETTPPPSTHHSAAVPGTEFLARVGTQVIAAGDYEVAANDAARRKFYHGKPPEAEVQALMREVAGQMINRSLVLQEAQRRRIAPDKKKVEETLAGYEERYRQSPSWQSNRARLLPGLRTRLEEDSQVVNLETTIRRVPDPTPNAVEAYYRAHPEKFTEPQRTRLGMILLQVPPSSNSGAWEAAEREAEGLVKKLQGGAPFAELAKIHSADESAARGGDLGFLHQGMIPEGIQETVDKMQPGEISASTRVLQGMALFRLAERQPPRLHPLSSVRERAADLLRREQSEQQWGTFIAGLRSKAKVEINTQRYPALASLGSSTH